MYQTKRIAAALPSDVLARVTREATVSAAAASIDPNDPLRSLRALAVIAAASGLKGDVDEEALTLRLDGGG